MTFFVSSSASAQATETDLQGYAEYVIMPSEGRNLFQDGDHASVGSA
jgi:hypothetical protein